MTTLPSDGLDALRSVWFRLDNLYWITDEDGRHIRFKMTPEQRTVLQAILSGKLLLVILKSRQLGMTTFIAILALDTCLFRGNVRHGLVDKSLRDARKILRDKVAYAYNHLPDAIKAMVPATIGAERITFANGSTIEVGASLRGGTYQFVHVTELAKIARRFPIKAAEISEGVLQTVHGGGIIVVESTAEGHGGLFHEMWQQTEATSLIPPHRLSRSDWHGLFFPWHGDRKYRDPVPCEIPLEVARYFARLKAEHGVDLDDEQKWWYVRKRKQLGEKTKQEYPSTPAEAFSGSASGTYYAQIIADLESSGQIGRVPHDPDLPVISLWDLGRDMMSVWLLQLMPEGWRHYIGYLEDSGKPIRHYLRRLEDLGRERGYQWGAHILPHDARHKGLRDDDMFEDFVRGLAKEFPDLDLGQTVTVDRIESIDAAVQMVRQQLLFSRFDRDGCAVGIERLRGYSQVWSNGEWSGTPRHDVNSHGADAFRTGVWLPEELLRVA